MSPETLARLKRQHPDTRSRRILGSLLNVARRVPSWAPLLAFVVLFFGIHLRGAFADEETESGAKQVLMGMEFREPEIKSSAYGFVGWKGCSPNDAIRYDMDAMTAYGPVKLSVCCGLFATDCSVRPRYEE